MILVHPSPDPRYREDLRWLVLDHLVLPSPPVMTMRAFGQRMGISKARVSQIKYELRRRLGRDPILSRPPDDPEDQAWRLDMAIRAAERRSREAAGKFTIAELQERAEIRAAGWR